MDGVTVTINNLGAGHMYEVSEEVEQLLIRLKSSGAVRHIRRRSAEHTQGYGMQKVGAHGLTKNVTSWMRVCMRPQ